MFRRGIRSVVPMDHQYLAEHDGSEQAEGRGSGADVQSRDSTKDILGTPFMSMVSVQIDGKSGNLS